MADEEPSSFTAAPSSTNLITELNDNDVLLGRGTGATQFIGNVQFRALAEQRQEEYKSEPTNKKKNKVAKVLFDYIRSLGGRFLKLVETGTPVNDIVKEGVWCEVDEPVALEKCKQALRAKWSSSDGKIGGINVGEMASREISAGEVSSDVGVSMMDAPSPIEVNDNDVLLGRGAGVHYFIGNKQFRRFVEERKNDYISARNGSMEKEMIARELFDRIQSLGGRFLKKVKNESSIWYEEVGTQVALEKCKQALRELREKQVYSDGTSGGLEVGSDTSRERNTGNSYGDGVVVVVDPVSLGGFGPGHGHPMNSSRQTCALPLMSPFWPLTLFCTRESYIGDTHLSLSQASTSSPFTVEQQAITTQSSPPLLSNLSPFLPLTMAGSTGPCVVDAGYLLFQAPFFTHQQQTTTAQRMATNHVDPSDFNASVQNQHCIRIIPDACPPGGSMSQDQYVSHNSDPIAARKHCLDNSALFSRLQVTMPWQTDFVSAKPDIGCNVGTKRPSTSDTDVSVAVSEVDMTEFLLSFLDSDRPMMSEEQVEHERAAMTDEERAQALADVFGKQCAIDTNKNKRARRDLDKNSIAFLVQQMRLELDRIPENEKRALVEAQAKCLADEFSDARLEQFLRCEGMNVKRGAQRFIKYWESRWGVFGSDKFALPMTLGEALCDDSVALEAGLYRPLPHLDASGRQLLFFEPCRHTREGYTSESMLRAVWYVTEVISQENTDMDSGFVFIAWVKDMTIWDFDFRLYDRIAYFDKSCWPVKIIASHVCCRPWIVVKYLEPIIRALENKHTRTRKMFHDIPENQLLDVLSDYGILENMLPTEMGGTIRLNQSEWIAGRRALELKEI